MQRRIPVAVPAGFTTWDPTVNKSANLNLDASHLTATNGASAYNGVLALASHSSGQYHFNVHVDSLSSNVLIGIGNVSATLTNFGGSNNNSIAYNVDGNVYRNGVSQALIATFATGSTISVDADLDTKKIWFRNGTGGYNNDILANQNPAVGSQVGGIDISAITGPYFPMVTMLNNTDAVTANFGASTYSPAAPSGFGNW